MTVLAHGAQGPFDEVVLVVPALVLLVLAVGAVRRRNARQPEQPGEEPPAP